MNSTNLLKLKNILRELEKKCQIIFAQPKNKGEFFVFDCSAHTKSTL